MSGKCRGWAGDQLAPSREIKTFLIAVADYANADGFMWPSVDTMATELQCSGRTVQRLLKASVAAGLLIRLDVEDRVTGRTRSCGYFWPVDGHAPSEKQVAAFAEMVGGRVTSVSPWEGDIGVTLEGDTGVRGRVTTVSPLNEPPVEPSGPEGPSLRAREREALVQKIETEMTPELLGVSKRPAYLDAIEVLAGDGVDLDELPGCVKRWVASKLFKGRRVPVPLERWLLDGQWRGWLPNPQLALETPSVSTAAPPVYAAPASDQVAWDQVRRQLALALTDGEFGTWVNRAVLAAKGGQLFVVAFSGPARDWIKGRCWKRIETWWREADAARRSLTLVSRLEFEAALGREGG